MAPRPPLPRPQVCFAIALAVVLPLLDLEGSAVAAVPAASGEQQLRKQGFSDTAWWTNFEYTIVCSAPLNAPPRAARPRCWIC